MKVYKDRTVCYLLLTDREETPTSIMKVYKDRTVCYLLLTDREETPTSTMKVYKDRTVCYLFCPSVLYLLAIVLSILLRYTDSACPFAIFKLYL
jgi:hypothetical protein